MCDDHIDIRDSAVPASFWDRYHDKKARMHLSKMSAEESLVLLAECLCHYLVQNELEEDEMFFHFSERNKFFVVRWSEISEEEYAAEYYRLHREKYSLEDPCAGFVTGSELIGGG